MIRTLFIIAGSAMVLCLASLAGAVALGGADLQRHGWAWTFKDGDGDRVRFERVRDGRENAGPTVTRTVAWTGGDSLSVDVGGDVTYIQGDTPGVVISGPQTVVDRIRVENGRIYMVDGEERVTIGWRNGELHGWSDDDRLTVTVTAPSVTKFDFRGSQDIDIRGYDQPTLDIDLSGSAEVRGVGRTTTLSVDISGSGEVDLSDLATRDATVSVSGSGEARVAPTGKADIDIAGSGDVYLTTRPASVTQDISGSGDVHND